jgi:hypothetical protein
MLAQHVQACGHRKHSHDSMDDWDGREPSAACSVHGPLYRSEGAWQRFCMKHHLEHALFAWLVLVAYVLKSNQEFICAPGDICGALAGTVRSGHSVPEQPQL